MSTHTATIDWQRGDQPFGDGKYSRAFRIAFDGGVELLGSATPAAVRPPLSREDAADPEELLAASVSSCHMLYFLDFARRDGWIVDHYRDDAVATLGKRDDGKLAITQVALRPDIGFVGPAPDAAQLAALHAKAHDACLIGRSLRAEVVVEG